MVKVIFVQADGTRSEVEAGVDDSVMNAAIDNDVEGIVGECGGSMMCATCHCYVDDEWSAKTGTHLDGEDDMLECAAAEVKPTSRLSCQIKLTEEMNGLVIHLPSEQI